MTEIGRASDALQARHARASRRDMALILLGAAVLAALIAVEEYLALPAAVARTLGVVRLVLGLAFVLYAPGYCLTAALFPRADDLDGIERNGLSLGLSVAWVPVLALQLDRLPWGLQLWPIFLGELATVLLFGAAAVWRRERLPAGEAFAPDFAGRPGPWWRSLPTLEQRIYLLCVGALVVAGLAAAWVFLVPSPNEFMTEFYILGREGLAEDYPRQAVAGETLSVTIGIVNRERNDMTYRVEVWAVDPWTGRREMVNATGTATFSPGDRARQAITWQMPWAGQDLMTEFYLFAEGQGQDAPYRSLKLWLDVAGEQ